MRASRSKLKLDRNVVCVLISVRVAEGVVDQAHLAEQLLDENARMTSRSSFYWRTWHLRQAKHKPKQASAPVRTLQVERRGHQHETLPCTE